MYENSKELKNKICNIVEERKDEIVKLCSEIIRIPSENPPGDTKNLADFLRDYIEERGRKVKTYEPQKGMPNLVAVIEGSKKRPNLVLNAHMDEFPAGNSELWESPPFSGEIKQGKILGRGAADMKGGLTALLYAFTLIHELDVRLPGKITLTLVSDEETGGKWGTEWQLDNVQGLIGDACLNGEPSGTHAVCIGEKGICWLRLKARGKSAHAALNIGENAIVKMSKAVPIIENLRRMRAGIPMELSKIVKEEKSFLEMWMGKDTAKMIDHVSVNIGLIKGGVKTNIVPDHCEVDVDTRVPVGVAPEDVKQNLENGLRNAGLEDVYCEFILKNEANYTSPNEKIVQLLRKNVREVVGREPRCSLTLGGSDGRFFRWKGVPTVIYGPNYHNIAAPNEYITIKDLIDVTKVHSCTIVDYLESFQ